MITAVGILRLEVLDCDALTVKSYEIHHTCRPERVEIQLRRCAHDYARTAQGQKILQRLPRHVFRWNDLAQIPNHFLQRYDILSIQEVEKDPDTLMVDDSEILARME